MKKKSLDIKEFGKINKFYGINKLFLILFFLIPSILLIIAGGAIIAISLQNYDYTSLIAGFAMFPTGIIYLLLYKFTMLSEKVRASSYYDLKIIREQNEEILKKMSSGASTYQSTNLGYSSPATYKYEYPKKSANVLLVLIFILVLAIAALALGSYFQLF